MNYVLLGEQFFNGFQLGIILFLMAAGLTLIFGIMDMVNLAHGTLYMLGRFFATTLAFWTASSAVCATAKMFITATLASRAVLECRNRP